MSSSTLRSPAPKPTPRPPSLFDKDTQPPFFRYYQRTTLPLRYVHVNSLRDCLERHVMPPLDPHKRSISINVAGVTRDDKAGEALMGRQAGIDENEEDLTTEPSATTNVESQGASLMTDDQRTHLKDDDVDGPSLEVSSNTPFILHSDLPGKRKSGARSSIADRGEDAIRPGSSTTTTTTSPPTKKSKSGTSGTLPTTSTAASSSGDVRPSPTRRHSSRQHWSQSSAKRLIKVHTRSSASGANRPKTRTATAWWTGARQQGWNEVTLKFGANSLNVMASRLDRRCLKMGVNSTDGQRDAEKAFLRSWKELLLDCESQRTFWDPEYEVQLDLLANSSSRDDEHRRRRLDASHQTYHTRPEHSVVWEPTNFDEIPLQREYFDNLLSFVNRTMRRHALQLWKAETAANIRGNRWMFAIGVGTGTTDFALLAPPRSRSYPVSHTDNNNGPAYTMIQPVMAPSPSSSGGAPITHVTGAMVEFKPFLTLRDLLVLVGLLQRGELRMAIWDGTGTPKIVGEDGKEVTAISAGLRWYLTQVFQQFHTNYIRHAVLSSYDAAIYLELTGKGIVVSPIFLRDPSFEHILHLVNLPELRTAVDKDAFDDGRAGSLERSWPVMISNYSMLEILAALSSDDPDTETGAIRWISQPVKESVDDKDKDKGTEDRGFATGNQGGGQTNAPSEAGGQGQGGSSAADQKGMVSRQMMSSTPDDPLGLMSRSRLVSGHVGTSAAGEPEYPLGQFQPHIDLSRLDPRSVPQDLVDPFKAALCTDTGRVQQVPVIIDQGWKRAFPTRRNKVSTGSDQTAASTATAWSGQTTLVGPGFEFDLTDTSGDVPGHGQMDEESMAKPIVRNASMETGMKLQVGDNGDDEDDHGYDHGTLDTASAAMATFAVKNMTPEAARVGNVTKSLVYPAVLGSDQTQKHRPQQQQQQQPGQVSAPAVGMGPKPYMVIRPTKFIEQGHLFTTYRANVYLPDIPRPLWVVVKMCDLDRFPLVPSTVNCSERKSSDDAQSHNYEYTRQQARQHVMHEVEMLSGPLRAEQGKSLPRLHGLWTLNPAVDGGRGEGELLMSMQEDCGGSLQPYDDQGLDPKYLSSALQAIQPMHDLGIIHGDIHPRHLLLHPEQTDRVVWCDLEGAESLSQSKGYSPAQAAEMIQEEKRRIEEMFVQTSDESEVSSS